MAILYFQVTALSRARGRSAPAAAAYRAGERLRDERQERIFNHSRRNDVVHKEILLPASVADAARAWADDRERLWNMAEAAEKRRDARVAREYVVSLPHELPAPGRLALARRFGHELAERYGAAVDLAVHLPRPAGDPRNHHAHLLTTTRVVTETGLGAKTAFELNGTRRIALGLVAGRDELRLLRARWASLANEALLAHGLTATLDPRTLAAQGIDRPPRHVPMAMIQMQRRGVLTLLEDRGRQIDAASPGGSAPERRTLQNPINERQARAREAWLRYRAEKVDLPPLARGRTRERSSPERAADENRSISRDRDGSDYDLTD